MTHKKAKRDYWLFGTLGSLTLGFGLCLLVESGFIKHNEASSWQWIGLGTLSLILIMSGINFLFKSFESKIKLKT
ncbi:hypothetical protein [Mesohalobacter halotolerans]|uniref:Uncharacterized protein n=1 Tax=Mesohalobacter halotolerans TaxID=1883405 RepID=A0A4U5TPA3_9FLAO|nr:hypothetical protein [Mesohalobacter halotolerans]MBS3739009.1 hypothetical protein [Psychroflexus sp.]TKS55783.1 hypothetical protein FCN74_10820 [Mesohalobacter halotolerans]